MSRKGQAQIFAQGLAFIFAPEEAALLFWNHQIHEILQSIGEEGRHDVEAIGGVLFKPFLEIIGDVSGRTMDDAVRPRAHNPLINLPD